MDFFTAQDFSDQTDAVMIEAAKAAMFVNASSGYVDFSGYSGSAYFCNYFESLGFTVDVHYEGGGSPPIHTTITI